MNMKKIITLLLSLILAIGAFAACSSDDGTDINDGDSADNGKIVIATGPKSSDTYKIGKEIVSVLNKNGMDAETLETEGYARNIKHLTGKNADLAVVSKDFLDDDVEVKTITDLYTESVHFVVRGDSNISSVDQLREKKIAIEKDGSRFEEIAEDLLDDYGLDYNDVKVEYVDKKEALARLKDKKVDAAFVMGKLPDKGIGTLAKDIKLSILPIGTDRVLDDLMEDGYEKQTIAVDTYGNKDKVATVGVKCMLVARNDISNDTINKIKKIIEDNKDTILKNY